MMRSTLLLLTVLGLAGCETFHSGSFAQQDAAPPEIDANNPDAHIPVPRALATTGDFGSPGTGVLSKLEVGDMAMTTNIAPGSALGDPVIRQYGDRVYVINRYGSNSVTILNAKTLALVDQISTGADSNPQDVAVVGTKLYVPALGTAGVVVLTPGAAATTIDLATPLGDSDGQPDCVSAYAIGNYVYVACDLATNFQNILDSKIAVIDTTSNTVVGQAITPHKNPLGFFTRAPASSPYNHDLLMPLGPNLYGDLTEGCVARISTTSPTSPTTTCGVTNATLGGFPNRIAVDADHDALYFAIVEDYGYAAPYTPINKLRQYNLATQTMVTAPLSASDQQIIDVAVCPGGDIVAVDQKTNAGGLRVWRGGTERTTSAIAIGRPPTATDGLLCYDP